MDSSQGKNRKWIILAVMTASLSMILVDQTIIGVALPRIQRDFQATQIGIQWVVSGYILAYAVFLAMGGRLGDIFGRAKTFAAGTFIFTLGSALCGFSTSIQFLIIARIIQGIGVAIMQPASAVLVSSAFGLEERGKAMATYAGIAMGFMAAGPLLGGFFTQYISWHWAFFINIPIGIYAFTASLIVKPPDMIVEGQKIDITGALLLILTGFSFIYSIQELNNIGLPEFLGLVSIGLVLSFFFYRHEKKAKDPLIDFCILKIKPFVVDMTVLFCFQFSMIVNVIFGAIYLQNILEIPPMQTGMIMIIQLIFTICASQVSGRLLDKYGPRLPIITGTLLMGLAFLSLAFVIYFRIFHLFILFNIVLGLGSGAVITAANTDSLSRVPVNLRGQSTGLMQTMRQIGSALGISISGSIIAGLEYMAISNLVMKAKAPPEHISVACSILSKTPDVQEAILKNLAPEKWEIVLDKIRIVGAHSISMAYIFTALIIFCGFLIACKYLPKGKQQGEAHHISAIE